MVFAGLSAIQTEINQGLEAREIRLLIAKHFNVPIGRVTDEAHFRHDLGADWLDRLEVLTLVEDRFMDVEIADDVADQIEVVGDLVRYVEEAHGRNVRHLPNRP
jgi:acyl carrier protein